MTKPDEPIRSETKAMCAVCAWRSDCKKKYNYDQFGPVKCADFTRDARLPEPDEKR